MSGVWHSQTIFLGKMNMVDGREAREITESHVRHHAHLEDHSSAEIELG